MKKFILLILLFFLALAASDLFAKKTYKYIAVDIPNHLKENAKAVVRVDETIFTIKSIGRATRSHKYAVTILKNNGDNFATFVEYYDKFRSINNLNICIYNAEGELIKKVKNLDIKDRSAVSGYSLYGDSRLKYYKPAISVYPYTIEYEFEVNYNGLLHYPVWQPLNTYEKSVESSSFKVVFPENLDFRFQEYCIDNEIVINTDNKNKVYTWSVSGLQAVEASYYSPYLYEITPIVYTAPNDFKIEGYVGSMQNWKSFGTWIYGLNSGLDKLPSETVEKLKNLVVNDIGDIAKVKRVYEYMQSKTRYVSIQLGIGGWQPFSASIVDEVGYGDCKALSNYMHAMLKSVGVKSFYTLVRAGKNMEIRKDFSSNQFNHAILCVPVENDTVWLECTSQSIPFGFLGDFTDDRDVLLITEEGGKIAHTKTYTQQDNSQFSKALVLINEFGEAYANIEINYAGLQYDDLRPLLNSSRENQKRALNKSLDLSNFEITDFNFYEKKDRMPLAELQLDIRLNKYASVSGKRLFIPLNLLNKSSFIPENKEVRKVDVKLNLAYHDSDTIIYKIPDNYQIENKPNDVHLRTEFGEYSASVIIEKNMIVYTRTKKIVKGRFSPEKYVNLVEFYKKIVKADKAKLVLIKKSVVQ